MVKPVFIFSLPRSGSTLLQRVLSRSDKVSTTAEPWVLLPLLYTEKDQGQFSEYWHGRTVEAIEDFCDALPEGKASYRAELKRLVMSLYELASDRDVEFFVDKTPRYHLIVDEIIAMFPEAKFIFLWRNPLGVASSIIETWSGNKFNIYSYKIDLYKGLSKLIASYTHHREHVHGVRYEDLLTSQEAWQELYDYVGLPFNPEHLGDLLSVQVEGRMGDPTGAKAYAGIDDAPLKKWQRAMANPIRRQWCKNYVNWLGAERMAEIGYDQKEQLETIRSMPLTASRLIPDTLGLAYGLFYSLCEPFFMKYKLRSIFSWRFMVSHR